MTEYIAKFPFGPANMYLQAEVNPTTRKQTLSIIKQDPKTGKIDVITTMQCIHTLVTTLSIDELEDISEDPDKKEAFLKKTVELRANNLSMRKPSQAKTELLRDGHEPERGYLLDLDEQFFAFKSWVQGIAEAGLDVIALNVECFESARLQFLTSRFLLWAFLYDNPDFIFQYFDKIVKECRFEGALHRASLWSNLDVLTHAIELPLKLEKYRAIYNFSIPPNDQYKLPDSYIKEYTRLVFELDVEYVFRFLHSTNWDGGNRLVTEFLNLILENDELIKRSDFCDLFNNISLTDNTAITESELRKYRQQMHVKCALAIINNNKVFEIPEYKNLFFDSCYVVRIKVADCEGATQFDDYRTLFHDPHPLVRRSAATNQKATRFEEFICLFSDTDREVRIRAAENSEAIKFPEYKNLLKDVEPLIQITAQRKIARANFKRIFPHLRINSK